jgi:hypothetical protein
VFMVEMVDRVLDYVDVGDHFGRCRFTGEREIGHTSGRP